MANNDRNTYARNVGYGPFDHFYKEHVGLELASAEHYLYAYETARNPTELVDHPSVLALGVIGHVSVKMFFFQAYFRSDTANPTFSEIYWGFRGIYEGCRDRE